MFSAAICVAAVLSPFEQELDRAVLTSGKRMWLIVLVLVLEGRREMPAFQQGMDLRAILIYFLLIDFKEREEEGGERERERDREINLLFHLFYAFIGCFLYVP